MKTIHAGYDRVLVHEIEPESITKSGLVIPESSKEKPKKGRVISVGPSSNEVLSNLVPFEEGQIVYYSKYSGDEFEFEDETIKSVKHSDIIAIEVNDDL